MSEFGLTGGIGSGKSTVAEGLVRRGAALVDADAIVKELQQPGEAVYDAMVDRFGTGILADDATLDRAAVAALVFGDPVALADLNEIVHGPVGAEMATRRAAYVAEGRRVVIDIPLLVRADGSLGQEAWKLLSGIIVVDTSIEVAVERLMAYRGFDEDDARARIAAQATRAQRLAVADHVIDNNGSPEALEAQLDACWEWMGGFDPRTARGRVTGGQ